jgi:hypothetical protein
MAGEDMAKGNENGDAALGSPAVGSVAFPIKFRLGHREEVFPKRKAGDRPVISPAQAGEGRSVIVGRRPARV